MRQIGIVAFAILLASTAVVPIGFSQAAEENIAEITNSTSAQNNATNSTSEQNNATSQNGKNVGQQVADFVHQAIADFKQQGNETRNAIKDCREKMVNATNDTRSQIQGECHTQLQSIKEKYQQERQQYQDLMKEFKDNMKILVAEARGHQVNNATKASAIAGMNEIKQKEMMQKLVEMKNKQMMEKLNKMKHKGMQNQTGNP